MRRAIFTLFIFISESTFGQQINPNSLPLCPQPDSSKYTDRERFSKWDNCWGTYRVEFDTALKGNVYEGEFKRGMLHGKAFEYHVTGDRYVGDYENGWKNGQGTYYFLSKSEYEGDVYIGEFKDDRKHGRGVYIKADGRRFEGIFENDDFVREAKVNLPNTKSTIANKDDRADIDSQRLQLVEERRRLEVEKRQREQQRRSQRLNLVVNNTQPTSDGSFTINVQTNADTASLLINGEEQGGRDLRLKTDPD